MPEDYLKLINIKPVLCGYIMEAQQMLGPGVPNVKVIHDVRVLMKKSRASIKLLNTQTDEESFNREYSAFRDVGRIMSSWRENSVHRKLLKDLKKRFPELFSRLKDNEKINLLSGNQQILNEPSPEMKKDLEIIIGILHKSAFRIRFQTMNNLDQKLITEELEKTFDNVSACFLKARNYTKNINLHRFRKKTKDFLYQLFFFRSLDPKAIKNLEKRIEALAQNLGKYNDYAVLIATLDYKYPSGENNSALDELIVIIKQEQDKYLSKIWPTAFRIFRPGKKLADLPGFKVPVV
jgi:CHAD domain-containing protein